MRASSEIEPTFQVAIPDQKFWVKIHATSPTNLPVEIKSALLELADKDQWTIDPATQSGSTLKGNQSADLRFTVHAAPNAGFTRPYFTRPNIEQAYYDIQEPKYLSLPLGALSALRASAI